MLRRENQLRLSDKIQREFLTNNEPNDVYAIANRLQKQTVREALIHFGILDSSEAIIESDILNGQRSMNSIRIRFGNKDSEINDSVMYLKYNREFLLDESKFLKIDDVVPFNDGIKLITLDESKQAKLDQLMHPIDDKMNDWLLITGSIS